MKKLLPRTATNTQGFTLIELMIAISIVAIMAVAGLLALNQAQRSGRDARRREEIQAMATVLEAKKDPSSTFYASITATDFPSKGAVPTDTTTAKYCLLQSATVLSAPPTPTTWADSSACPTVPALWGTNSAAFTGPVAATTVYWMLCARLEASDAAGAGANLRIFCTTSSQ